MIYGNFVNENYGLIIVYRKSIIKHLYIMKNHIILTAALTAFSLFSVAQETSATNSESGAWEQKSIFKSGTGKIDHGFYGGVMTRYGQVDGESAFLFGAKGAWIINHSLGIGIAGNGNYE